MKSLVVAFVLVLTACSGGTSLEGSIECGMATCSSGHVCATTHGGIDAGIPEIDDAFPRTSCVAPGDCELEDCSGEDCPPCVAQICGCTYCAVLVGRELTCSGG